MSVIEQFFMDLFKGRSVSNSVRTNTVLQCELAANPQLLLVAIKHLGDSLADPASRQPQSGEAPLPQSRFISTIEINKSCGLNCVMCRASDYERAKVLFDIELFRDLMRHFQLTGQKSVGLNFYSDPLINAKLGDYLELMRQHGITAETIHTTGAFISDAQIEALIEYSDVVKVLCFSLDAAEKPVYEQIRAGAKWERLNDNLRKLKARYAERGASVSLVANNVIHKLNFDQIPKIVDHFSDVIERTSHTFYFIESNGVNPFFEEHSFLGDQYWSGIPCEMVASEYAAVMADGRMVPCCSEGTGSLAFADIRDFDLRDPDAVLKMKEAPEYMGLRYVSATGAVSASPPACRACYVIDRRCSEILNLVVQYLILSHRGRPATDWAAQLDRAGALMQVGQWQSLVPQLLSEALA